MASLLPDYDHCLSAEFSYSTYHCPVVTIVTIAAEFDKG
jgi:hypothetical protein